MFLRFRSKDWNERDFGVLRFTRAIAGCLSESLGNQAMTPSIRSDAGTNSRYNLRV